MAVNKWAGTGFMRAEGESRAAESAAKLAS